MSTNFTTSASRSVYLPIAIGIGITTSARIAKLRKRSIFINQMTQNRFIYIG
ncbi:MAG: hypothetical protein O7F74_08000 [Bacteroidetes bacterium]|nr:hypothetical protein [Bacteroidota bacterium]